MDSGCPGNRVSLPVPATTGGGSGGDTGEGVSLSRALKESSTEIYHKEECLCVVRNFMNDTYMYEVYIRRCK